MTYLPGLEPYTDRATTRRQQGHGRVADGGLWRRRPKPRLGRSADGPTRRLDRPEADADLGDHAWPSGRGEPQRPGEPPRLVAPKSVANRGARLKALGNGVVWQQAHAAIVRALEVLP